MCIIRRAKGASRPKTEDDRRLCSPSWPICSRKQTFYDFRSFNKIFQNFSKYSTQNRVWKLRLPQVMCPLGPETAQRCPQNPTCQFRNSISRMFRDGRWRIFTESDILNCLHQSRTKPSFINKQHITDDGFELCHFLQLVKNELHFAPHRRWEIKLYSLCCYGNY